MLFSLTHFGRQNSLLYKPHRSCIIVIPTSLNILKMTFDFKASPKPNHVPYT